MRATLRRERGQSFSVLVITVMLALLLVAGLVIDGGAQATASRRAETAAAEAARAAVDAGATARAAGQAPNPGLVEAAGRRVLVDRGVDGTVRAVAGRIEVSTSLSVPTMFLGLVGIDRLRATGSAQADLRAP